MSTVETGNEALFKTALFELMDELYVTHGFKRDSQLLKTTFRRLIERLYQKYDKRVIVLIDEYDKPILDHLEDHEMAEKIRTVLRTFYSTLKVSDEFLDFVFITGITKFTSSLRSTTRRDLFPKSQKVSGVFSTLNNLQDISTNERYASMMGYTRGEIERNFEAYEFKNYWVESGSPSFIVKYARTHNIELDKVLGDYLETDILTTYEIEEAPPVSFLIQAGYLTFKAYDADYGYLIDYLNKEVRDSFSKLLLLSEYGMEQTEANDIRKNSTLALKTRGFDLLYRQMKRTLSNIPYTLFEKKRRVGEEVSEFNVRQEAFYHAVILTMLWAAGINVKAEELTALGRSDLILEYEDDVYIIELKKQPPEVSLRQIAEKDYAGKYNGNLFYVGIEIEDEKRNLSGYILKEEK